MKTFLVTGGAGFIGSHLVERLLQQGDRVVVLDNFHDFYDYQIKLRNLADAIDFHLIPMSSSKDKDIQAFAHEVKTNRFQLVYGDIRDADILEHIFSTESIDIVVHLAALAGVRPSIENPLAYEAVNVRGSLLIWEMCKKYKVHKVICASSSSVYGNNPKVPFAETDIVDNAISPYAATKKAGEVLGHVYHALYQIDMIQLRFFTVYGPRQRPDLAIHKFAKRMLDGVDIPLYGDGESGRDYTYIDDIMDGVLKSIDYLVQHNEVYEILNLGESKVIRLHDMVATLERALGKKAKINRLPMQAGDVNMTYADIGKAKEMIGYAPQTTFEKGVEKFVHWLKQTN